MRLPSPSLPGLHALRAADPGTAIGWRSLEGVRRLLWALALTVGALDAWASRTTMNPDGIAYLDMGDAFWRHDWHQAVNGLWSPLYGWLVGSVLGVFSPPPSREFAAVHVVNFAIYAVALVCFDFFLRALIRGQRRDPRPGAPQIGIPVPPWAWYAVGYPVFMWSSLAHISIAVVAPDMLASALVFLASGLLLEIRAEPWRPRPFAMLGAVLGVGYLVRAPLFLLALAVLGGSASLAGGGRRALRGVLLGGALFLAISAPWIIALSVTKGSVTLGESATLNYAYHVDQVPYVHWQGGPPGCGTATHPVRQIVDHPAVFTFGGPIVATYPLWYDPSYWYAGIAPCFDVGRLLPVLLANLEALGRFLGEQYGGLAVVVLTLLCWGRSHLSPRARREGLADGGPILFVAGTGLAAFTWVHVETRFIAVFAALLWLGALAAVRLPPLEESRRVARAVVAAFLTLMSVSLGLHVADGLQAGARDPTGGIQWQVADALQRTGLRPGDGVAVIGTSFREYWARLARVRIVAEVPDESVQDFWAAPPHVKARVFRALAAIGARAVLVPGIPGGVGRTGWHRMGDTYYFVHLLR